MADGTGNDCFRYLIGDTPKNYACGSPGLFPASSLKRKNCLKNIVLIYLNSPKSISRIYSLINYDPDKSLFHHH